MNALSELVFNEKPYDDSFLRSTSSLSTAALETVAQPSDLITPTLTNGLQAIDSSFLVECRQLLHSGVPL